MSSLQGISASIPAPTCSISLSGIIIIIIIIIINIIITIVKERLSRMEHAVKACLSQIGWIR
jgi:hypothetical protein